MHRPVQMFELAVATDDTEEVRVEGMAPETYLERFAWDEAKYPPRRPLNETVSAITDIVQQLEDGLKVGTPCWRRPRMCLVWLLMTDCGCPNFKSSATSADWQGRLSAGKQEAAPRDEPS